MWGVLRFRPNRNDCGAPEEQVDECTLASHGGTIAIVQGLDEIGEARSLSDEIACPSASSSHIYYFRMKVLAVAAGQSLPQTFWIAAREWFGPGETRLVTLQDFDGIWAALASIPVVIQSEGDNEPPYEMANDFERLSERAQSALEDFSSTCPDLELLSLDEFRQRAIGSCDPGEEPLERFHPEEPRLCDRLVDHYVFNCGWNRQDAYDLGERCNRSRQDFAPQKQNPYVMCLSRQGESCEAPGHRFKSCDPRLRPQCQEFVDYLVLSCGDEAELARSAGDVCQSETEGLGAEDARSYVACLEARSCDVVSSSWDECH